MRGWPVLVGTAMVLAGCGGSDAEPVIAAEAASPTVQVDVDPTRVSPTVQVDVDPTRVSPTVPVDVEPTRSIVEDELLPEVIAAKATRLEATSWRIDVTMLSEYDSPVRYADAWRVLDRDGGELGIRVLTHDHASEQPFTRSTTVEIPSGTTTVFIEGRDQRNGWSGQRFELAVS